MIVYFYSHLIFKVRSVNYVVFFGFIMVLWDILDYWYLNTVHVSTLVDSIAVNPLLTNSINKYHPLIFYVVTVTLAAYTYIYSISSCIRLTPFTSFNTGKWIMTLFNRIWVIGIVVTLFMGSWWALQEGSWGGWWNWDPSEVFGLVVMLLLLMMSHKPLTFTNRWVSSYLITASMVCLILIYLFIQLNFSLVSHNFGIKSTPLVNPIQGFTFLFILFTVCIVRLYRKGYVGIVGQYLLLRISYVKYTGGNQYVTSIFILLLLLEVIYSFYPLINDFIWRVFSISTLNTSLTIYVLVGYVFTVGSISYAASPALSTLLLILLLTQNILTVPLVLLTFSAVKFNILSLLHTLVRIFMYITLLYLSRLGTYWTFDAFGSILGVYEPHIVAGLPTFGKGSSSVEVELLSLVEASTQYLTNYFFYKNVTTPEGSIFTLTCSYVHTNQVLVDGLFVHRFFINVVDYGVNQSTSLTLTLIALVIYFVSRPLRIVY